MQPGFTRVTVVLRMGRREHGGSRETSEEATAWTQGSSDDGLDRRCQGVCGLRAQ